MTRDPAGPSPPVVLAEPTPTLDRFLVGLGLWLLRLRSSVRSTFTPTYGVALAVMFFFVWWAGGAPSSYFALSLVYASIYITLALAWDFSSGLTGYLNFGLPFFFGLGAFAAGYLSWHDLDRSVPQLLAFAFGVGLGGGLLFSLPTLRLRGPYFTLLSLLLPLIGADFVISFWTQLHLPTEGYYNLPFLASNPEGELVLITGVNVVLLTVLLLLRGSHFGLVLRGIRDDEDALGSQGIWTFPYKVVAFTLASGIAAFAGACYGMVFTYAGVDAFDFVFILFPVLIVILGGIGELVGAVFAGFLLILLYQYLFPTFATLTLLLFAAIAIVLVLFLPNGLLKPVRAFFRFMRTGVPG